MHKRNYPLIDIMRIIASILVIGIHTYPFLQISPSLDFITTHIIGRIAVPFFFMTTAFFLFEHGEPTLQRLKKTLNQLGIIYLICIFIYIPIQIYNNTLIQSVPNLIQDIFMDGTFYHLWYLPATLIGISLVYIIYKYCSLKLDLFLSSFYIIGLGGDSYYGFSIQIPILKSLYNSIFQFCEYTRNGYSLLNIFMARSLYCSAPTQNFQISLVYYTLY
ncbi:MAG: acyltransferase family protein [Coprobacillus cateniformis]